MVFLADNCVVVAAVAAAQEEVRYILYDTDDDSSSTHAAGYDYDYDYNCCQCCNDDFQDDLVEEVEVAEEVVDPSCLVCDGWHVAAVDQLQLVASYRCVVMTSC